MKGWQWGLIGCGALFVIGGGVAVVGGGAWYAMHHRQSTSIATNGTLPTADAAPPLGTPAAGDSGTGGGGAVRSAPGGGDGGQASTAEVDAVDRAIMSFHGYLNQAAYEDIWNSYSDNAHAAVSRDQIIGSLRELHDDAGEVREWDRVSVTPLRVDGTRVLRVVYRTRFERGTVNEVFVYREEGDALALQVFNISN